MTRASIEHAIEHFIAVNGRVTVVVNAANFTARERELFGECGGLIEATFCDDAPCFEWNPGDGIGGQVDVPGREPQVLYVDVSEIIAVHAAWDDLGGHEAAVVAATVSDLCLGDDDPTLVWKRSALPKHWRVVTGDRA